LMTSTATLVSVKLDSAATVARLTSTTVPWRRVMSVETVQTASILLRVTAFPVSPVGLLHVNPVMGTLKPQSNEPLYINTVTGTLAVDGWAVTFVTTRRGLGGAAARPVPSSLYQM